MTRGELVSDRLLNGIYQPHRSRLTWSSLNCEDRYFAVIAALCDCECVFDCLNIGERRVDVEAQTLFLGD